MGDKVTLKLETLYRLLEDAYNNGFEQKEAYKETKGSVVDKCLNCLHRTKTGGTEACKDCKLAKNFM